MKPLLEHFEPRAVVVAVFVLLVLMCIPLSLVWVYQKTYEAIDIQVSASQSTLVDLGAQAVKIKLDGLVNIATSMAATSTIVSDMANGKWIAAADAARDMENSVQYYDPFIDRIIIYDPQGIQQAAYPALIGGLGTSAASGSWYMALSSGTGSSYVTNVLLRTSKPQIQVVSIAVPVKTPTGAISGFLVFQIPTDNFLAFGENISTGVYSFAYIVDTAGNLVAHPKYSLNDGQVINYSFDPAVKDVMSGKEGTMAVRNAGVDGIVTYRTVPGYKWGVIEQELQQEAFAGNNSILWDIKLLITITLAADILIAYMLFRMLNSHHE